MPAIMQVFLVSLLAGLLLIGMEIFLPGGVLGVMGGIALLLAMLTGFAAFPGYGLFIAVAIIALLAVVIALWVKFFPGTRTGQRMTVARDMADAKAADTTLQALAGQEGEALSDLRPGGFARIDGRRVDVVTRGEMLHKGERVRVVQVEGYRVVVARATNTVP